MGTMNEQKNGTTVTVVDYRALASAKLDAIKVLNNRAKECNATLDEHLIPMISTKMSVSNVKTEIGYTVTGVADDGLKIAIDGKTELVWNGKDFTFFYNGKTLEHYKAKKADKEFLDAITKAQKKFFGEVNEKTYLDLSRAYYELLEERYREYVRTDAFASAMLYNGYETTENALTDATLTVEDIIKVWLEESK